LVSCITGGNKETSLGIIKMKNQTEIEDLIRAARAGNEKAKADFFSKLDERFFLLVTRKLREESKYSILTKRIDIDEKSHKICQDAITEVKRLYSLSNPEWSLVRAVRVLHNILDDFIANSLIDLAKKGNRDAENLLFSILREKLLIQMAKKNWKVSRYANKFK
jgi:hypothetical protein